MRKESHQYGFLSLLYWTVYPQTITRMSSITLSSIHFQFAFPFFTTLFACLSEHSDCYSLTFTFWFANTCGTLLAHAWSDWHGWSLPEENIPWGEIITLAVQLVNNNPLTALCWWLYWTMYWLLAKHCLFTGNEMVLDWCGWLYWKLVTLFIWLLFYCTYVWHHDIPHRYDATLTLC